MSGKELLASLAGRGVLLSVREGRLTYRAPPGAYDDALKAEVAANRAALLEALGVPPARVVEVAPRAAAVAPSTGQTVLVEVALLPCPGCKKPLDGKGRCWKCDYRSCSKCGAGTGTAFIELCCRCGLAHNHEGVRP